MNILIWIQVISGAVIAVALAALAAHYAFDVYLHWAWDRKRSTREAQRAELAREIHHLVHWFGESRETFEALKIIGETLSRGEGLSASHIRDKWREAIKSDA